MRACRVFVLGVLDTGARAVQRRQWGRERMKKGGNSFVTPVNQRRDVRMYENVK